MYIIFKGLLATLVTILVFGLGNPSAHAAEEGAVLVYPVSYFDGIELNTVRDMHSPTDNTVGISNASDIFKAARHPRNFVSLEGSDHLLTARGQAQRAARIVSAWADQYLGDRGD